MISTSCGQSDVLKETADALRRCVAVRFPRHNGTGVKCPLLQVSVSTAPMDLLGWLASRADDIKMYWADRSGRVEIAAAGVAMRCNHARTMEDVLAGIKEFQSLTSQAHCFATIAFTPAWEKTWENLGAAQYVIPTVEWCRKDDRYRCTFSIPVSHDSDVVKCTDSLVHALCSGESCPDSFPGAIPQPLSIVHDPTGEQWARQVNTALTLIRQNAIQKVVLARKTRVKFAAEVDPLALFHRFAHNTVRTFRFFFQYAPHLAFFGASPERLFKRRGRSIQTEAVAGTRPRAVKRSQDISLRNELLASEKEQREHAIVVQAIRARLDALCETFCVEDSAHPLRLATCQHLQTTFTGTLKTGVDDVQILQALHPTPAVGGFPHDAALKTIAELESFPRGFYAGPVGVLNLAESEFAVGIRSALVHGNELSLYAGAGIVEGSEPEQEWAELDTKLSSYQMLLEMQT